MKLSVVIPAFNEADSIAGTVRSIYAALKSAGISHEIVVIDDHSSDATWKNIHVLESEVRTLRGERNRLSRGYGMAVRAGLEIISGNVVCVMMADGSDSARDLVAYYRQLVCSGADCVFGSRFIDGSRVSGYPVHKLIMNRLLNTLIRYLFGIRYNDTTNAFKMFRREVIEGVQPLLSRHFNLTVELPLKAIVRGYSFAVIPISWQQRKSGVSKLKLKEMGSRYMFIILYCFLEKWLARGDYHRTSLEPAALVQSRRKRSPVK